MKKILVPIDFSPVSRIAGEYACYFAKVIDAEVHVMHASEPVPISPEPHIAEVITEDQVQSEYEDLLNREMAYLREKYLVKIHGHPLAGFKLSTIIDAAAQISPDVIVMGTGQTAMDSVRRSKIPVLMVPENAPFTPLKHIVLAVDFHEIANPSCFDFLSEIVHKFDAMLNVVHVKPKSISEKATEQGKLQLEQLLSTVTFWYQLVEDDDIDHGIRQFIQSHPAQLLVMVAHRHNLLERIFGTGHTSTISNETNLPLLILEDK